MWALSDRELLFVCVAGLILGGLVLLRFVVALVRPVLPEVAPKRSGRWTRAFLTRRALSSLALTATFLGVTAIVVGGAIGVRAGAPQPVRTSVSTLASTVETASALEVSSPRETQGVWVAGDMHTHTILTGGSNSQLEVAHKALNEYGLDWMANSDHGGLGTWDPSGNAVRATPRWWSLINWSWPIMRDLRPSFPGKSLIQGVEWNVPAHRHASVGIVVNEPNAIAEFDYRFDRNSDSDSFPGSPPKDNESAHDAIRGVAWLQTNYPDSAYVVLNHPSLALTYEPGDVRDFLAAGPDVMAGFEGMPGHQKEPWRGGYESRIPTALTYQGADLWLAQVGGVWDSILANGSRFHVFANSDFHDTRVDFWPGEYAKNWTFVAQPDDMKSVVAGLKGGRSFSSFGGLVDQLEFSAQSEDGEVTMGREPLAVRRGGDVIVTIRFHSPALNSHGDAPKVDHLDVIAGDVTGPAVKGDPSWSASTNPSARVVRTIESTSLKQLEDGWFSASYALTDVRGPMYLRLRATNVAPNTPGITDAAGNPLVDAGGENTPDKVWKSLWFYSNPLWIDVR